MGKIYATANPEMSLREKKNQDIMRGLASQGMVLLENDGSLPLKPSVKKLALYGIGARHTVKGGTGSGDVNSRNVVSVEQGLENAGYEITTKQWLNRYDEILTEAYEKWGEIGAKEIEEGLSPLIYLMEKTFKEPPVQEIKEEDVRNSDTDTAIYVLSRNSGEGADRYNRPGDYELSQEEKRDITFLTEKYAHVIVLLNVGGILDTRFLRNTKGINAVLLMSQAGNISGDAVADIISGKVNPSGKLTDTWAEVYEDYPFSEEFSHNNGNLDDAYYKEGIYVGYRYFDTFDVTPAYCFGYGKSYSEFDIRVDGWKADEKEITVWVTVENKGPYPGKEVVQMYYSAPEGILEKPYQELGAFGKTRLLQVGESQQLTLICPIESMASYWENGQAWLLEKGTYYIRIGNSSRNTHIVGAVRLNKSIVTQKVKNLFPGDKNIDELTAKGIQSYTYPGEKEEKEEAERSKVSISEEKISCQKAIYRSSHLILKNKAEKRIFTLQDVRDGKITLDELVGQMSPEEMTSLCVGKVKEWFSAIGNACTTVPGAAGDTIDSMMESRKIPSVIMADGPAGLRLTKEFQLDKDGHVGGDGGFTFPEIMQKAMKSVMPPSEMGEPVETYYQYCTAIPIATLLAQSWDMELIETCGKIVGEEMLEFGVNLWLAPGMNIHRNPLCGRNFEYYSEDPLLSGKCAAADTKGVQMYHGTGTTIKHFATNNQEDNRSFENNHVTERTLREIYLKGFEICIREAQPLAMMTSYNLLNGIHTANNYNLLTALARDEWGFEGLVMTDWGTTGSMQMFNHQPKYPSSSAAMCIKAGNDLIMPGMKEDIEDILNSLNKKEGEVLCPLQVSDLQYTTKNILQVILKIFT